MEKLGILAGGGKLPALIIQDCINNNKPYHVLTFKGQAEPEIEIPAQNHTLCPAGALAKMVNELKKQQVKNIVMAGAINRPSIFDLRPDAITVKFLKSLVSKQDDALLSKLCEFWQGQGFNVLGAHEVLPSLITSNGYLTKTKPTHEEKNDIKKATEAVKTLGKLDIGQAVIIKDGTILGVEAIDGTNALIERCASLRGKKNKGGILVKFAKPQQNIKVDMPTTGVQTIELLKKYKYAGLALEAGRTIMLDSQEMIKIADKAKIFIQGAK